MAAVRRQKGDKTRVSANGNLIVTRANGNVVKINAKKGIVVRKKADGTKVTQKWTPTPTSALKKTGSTYSASGGVATKWNIGSIPRKQNVPNPQPKPSRPQDRNR
jgi:hypothetical protein